MINPRPFQRILGIRFFVGSAEEAVQIGLQGGCRVKQLCYCSETECYKQDDTIDGI